MFAAYLSAKAERKVHERALAARTGEDRLDALVTADMSGLCNMHSVNSSASNFGLQRFGEGSTDITTATVSGSMCAYQEMDIILLPVRRRQPPFDVSNDFVNVFLRQLWYHQLSQATLKQNRVCVLTSYAIRSIPSPVHRT